MKLSPAVRAVLEDAETDGNRLTLNFHLDRKLYLEVDKALQAAGGKWNRKAEAHLFDGDAEAALDAMLTSNEIATPQDKGYFPTPDPIAELVIDTANIGAGMTVLEPSAGTGAMAIRAARAGALVTCAERDVAYADFLGAEREYEKVHCGDFLAMTFAEGFDRVIMNPPFAMQQDVRHVTHALRFLKPDGLLVAIMSRGVEFRETKLTSGFRTRVRQRGGTIKRLPDDAFVESGTRVRTVMVTVPGSAAEAQDTFELVAA